MLLVGEQVLKMKKPVALGFLDYSAREDRLRALRRELELNQRLAPDVYLSVSDVNGDDGLPLDHLLVMRRLPDDRRLASLLSSGSDIADGLGAVAKEIALFHERCDRGPDVDADATRDALAAKWRRNLTSLRTHRSDGLDLIESLVDSYLRGRSNLFQARIDAGAIVDGHGDLLADDIFLLPDGPRILDCLEFDDHLRHLDRLDDVASLVMDLERLGAPQDSARFVEEYRAMARDEAPASLLHHFVAYRALMRALVSCLPGAADPRSTDTLLELAQQHLIRGRVRLVLVGGPPGTGKTTVARACGEAFGWKVIHSDEVRKTLAGMSLDHHAPAGVDEGLYTETWTSRTYGELLRQAESYLSLGESVVIDATWRAEDLRDLARGLARSTSSDLVEVRCDAPQHVADERIRLRRADASDASVEVAAALRADFDDWPDALVLDTRHSVDEMVAAVMATESLWSQ